MKNKPKKESKKLLCPKACVLNQLDDDRHSDTVVLETKKAIASTLTMLSKDRQKSNTVRRTEYKLQELAVHVDLFNPKAVKHYVATAISEKTKEPFLSRDKKTSSFMRQTNSMKTKEYDNPKSRITYSTRANLKENSPRNSQTPLKRCCMSLEK